jgi:peptide/nickel transport system substrate-binding protein
MMLNPDHRGPDRPRGRHFSRVLGLLVLCITIAATASACGSSSSSSDGSNGSTGASAKLVYTTPPGSGAVDSITWDMPFGEPVTLDYVKAGDYSPDMLISNLCDYMLRFDPKWGLHPAVAQSYNYPNPTTLVFNIRPDIKFWDGKPLTADDVAYSLNRNMDTSTGAVNGGFFKTVKSITQTGTNQVTVKFSAPDELFIKEMATVAGGVVEKAYVQRVGDKSFGTAKGSVMCSGPYKLQSWTPGQEMVLVKNPNYWDKSLQPKIGKVTVKFISDTSTLTAALKSGEVDGAYEMPPVSIPALNGLSTGKVYMGPSLAIEILVPAATSGPAANPKVRQALGMVMDRAAIAEKIYNGAGEPNKALTPPTAWTPDNAKSVYQAAYDKLPGGDKPDVDGAKKLLQGVSDLSQPMVLAIGAGDQTAINLATLIQEGASQIGLTVKIKQMQPLDFSNLFFLPQYRKGVDLVLSSGYLDVPDQLDYLPFWIYKDSFFNWTGYDNKQVQQQAGQALQTFNGKQRATLLTEAQASYMKDQIAIPILALNEVLYLSNKLGGATTSFAYLFQPSFAYLGAR